MGTQLLFFRERKNLDFLRRYSPEFATVDHVNIDGLIGAIIEADRASLRDLTEWYTLEEAFDIWEVIVVGRWNEHLAIQHAKGKG